MNKAIWNALGASSLAILCALPAQTIAQGVPVIDGQNLGKNIEMLRQALTDAENQVKQIEELKAQVEKLTDIEGLLDEVLGSLSGLNEIGELYNSAQDLRSRAAKITDLSGFAEKISIGDFEGLLEKMLDGEVTMGEKRAAESIQHTLTQAGLPPERLGQLSSSEEPQNKLIAQTAGASATAMAAAQISYDEAAESLERVEGLVGEISRQRTMKESIDLNTRMAAETNFMLGQMWRLNAAEGLASGQMGVNWAAEQAKERAFFNYGSD